MEPGQPQFLDIDMRTPYGRLKGRLSVPPHPIRLAESAYNFLGFDQQLIEMAVGADGKAGNSVSCAKGCSACCTRIHGMPLQGERHGDGRRALCHPADLGPGQKRHDS